MWFDIAFGKVKYAQGAPKNAPRWVWRCTCAECDAKGTLALHGPFKTKREAERDAAQCCRLIAFDTSGAQAH
jgi:hypothetical protein